MDTLNLRAGVMPAFLMRRLLQALSVSLLVGTLCFFMLRALPGDLAMRVAASRYGYDLVSDDAAKAVARELGLDQPWWQALGQWLVALASGHLGQSLVTGESVWVEVRHQLGHTIDLGLTALLLALLIGLPWGWWCGQRPGGAADRLSMTLAALLKSTPHFLLAVTLMLGVGVLAGALPVAGHHESGSVLLPALTLALGLSAGLARVTRDVLQDVWRTPMITFARTKGLSDRQTLRRHALRHVAAPVTAYLGVHAVILFEGAVVVESLFAWPGIGHALVHAIFGRDIPMLQGCALCMCLLFTAFSLATDVTEWALDPRGRDHRGGPQV